MNMSSQAAAVTCRSLTKTFDGPAAAILLGAIAVALALGVRVVERDDVTA